ncbi:MAG: hypothetical protein J5861_01830 [Desulfovibrio sp.]|nr:hypothetical protein [Desulfovibrio sp.]
MPSRLPHSASPSPSHRTSSRKPLPHRLEGKPTWSGAVSLFPPLPKDVCTLLTRLPEALHRIRPLKSAHKRSLPDDVAALSQILTRERDKLDRPYWANPAYVSAYLYYFLPWNLIRLTRLLTALPLPDPCCGQGSQALLVDMGSGPLTLPLALWLARPQWRSAPVSVLALDTSPQPLQLGRALMETLGLLTGFPVWPIHTAKAPMKQAARQAAPFLNKGHPWLLSAANVLNETQAFSPRHDANSKYLATIEPENGEDEDFEESHLDDLLTSLAPLLKPFGDHSADCPAWPALLFVEPGTRLGGSTVMRLRKTAMDEGLTVLAPCTHQHPCPLHQSRTWCHFTFDSTGAPTWLTDLSAAAGLAKNALSLSPLLLSSSTPTRAESGCGRQARVISSPMKVPHLHGKARYACSAQGLLLLEDSERLSCGDSLPIRLPCDGQLDRKSGARLVRPAVTKAGHGPGRDK